MIKLPAVNKATKFVVSDRLALDGAELIPIDCGGRLLTPSLSVNDLGKMLLNAAAEGNVEETKSLLNRGALFTADWLGTSPLHLAARHNHLEICEILLRAGISRDARTKVDKTSLHIAAYEGHIGIVETLLEFGADPDCKDLLGMTPLHWAAQNGHVDVVKCLIKHFAQVNHINKFDLTASDIATQINCSDIVDLINLASITNNSSNMDELETATMLDTTQQLHISSSENDDSNFPNSHINNHDGQSASNSPIPLETILLEGSENSIDTDKFQIPNNNSDLNQQQKHFLESMKLLQEHGIAMLPTHTDDDDDDDDDDGDDEDDDENDNILTSVMESGHSVVLTDVGKQVLKSMKETEEKLNKQTAKIVTSPLIEKKKILTLTPEEFLAMATSTTKTNNILKQINGRLVPKNVKRIVMKKNKIVPVSSQNNINKISKTASLTDVQQNKTNNNNNKISSTDMETVMTQLIEARKTIEEYKQKLMKKEQEVERYKQQLKQFMDLS